MRPDEELYNPVLDEDDFGEGKLYQQLSEKEKAKAEDTPLPIIEPDEMPPPGSLEPELEYLEPTVSDTPAEVEPEHEGDNSDGESTGETEADLEAWFRRTIGEAEPEEIEKSEENSSDDFQEDFTFGDNDDAESPLETASYAPVDDAFTPVAEVDDEEGEDFSDIEDEEFSNPFGEPLSRQSTTDKENDDAALPNDEVSSPGDGAPKESVVDRAKAKLATTIAQIKSELKGEDGPKASPKKANSNEDSDDNADDEAGADAEGDEEDKEGGSSSSAGGGPSKGSAIARKVFFPYIWVAEKLLGLLRGIFQKLGSIPTIGAQLLRFAGSKFLKIVAYVLPLLLLLLVLRVVEEHPPPASTTLTGPDNGSVTFSGFSYDSKNHMAKGTISNTGDVIARVAPDFQLYAIRGTLNPFALFRYSKIGECSSVKTVTVAIAAKQNVSIACSLSPSGRGQKLVGRLTWTE